MKSWGTSSQPFVAQCFQSVNCHPHMHTTQTKHTSMSGTDTRYAGRTPLGTQFQDRRGRALQEDCTQQERLCDFRYCMSTIQGCAAAQQNMCAICTLAPGNSQLRKRGKQPMKIRTGCWHGRAHTLMHMHIQVFVPCARLGPQQPYQLVVRTGL